MKKRIATILTFFILLSGCSSPNNVAKTETVNNASSDTSDTLVNDLQPEEVSVPNFVGMDIDTARVLAEKHGIYLDVYYETDSKKPSGEIVYQNAEAHSVIPMWSSINVIVSEGEDSSLTATTEITTEPSDMTLLMPDFVGRTYNETFENRYAMLIFEAEYDYSNEYSEGLIFEQSVPEGTEIAYGTLVHIKVSLGSRTPQYPVYPTNWDTLGSLMSDYYEKYSLNNIIFQNGVAMVVGQKRWLVFDEEGNILLNNDRGSLTNPWRLNNDTFYNDDILYDRNGNIIVSPSKQGFDDVVFYDQNYLLVHKSESGFSQVKELYGFINTEGEWIKPLTENLKFFDYYDLNKKYDYWSSNPEFVRTGISSNYLLIRESSYDHYVIYDIENDNICFDESGLDYSFYTYDGNIYFSNADDVYFTYFDTKEGVKKNISVSSNNFDNDFYYRNGVICEEDSTGMTRNDYFHESSDIYNIYDLNGNKIMGFDGYHIKYVYAFINDIAIVSARGADDDYYVCFIDKNGTLLFDPLLGNDDYILKNCIISETGFICQPFYSPFTPAENTIYIIGFDGSIKEIECKYLMINWDEESGYFITYNSVMSGTVCYYTLDGELRIVL